MLFSLFVYSRSRSVIAKGFKNLKRPWTNFDPHEIKSQNILYLKQGGGGRQFNLLIESTVPEAAVVSAFTPETIAKKDGSPTPESRPGLNG
jgi:hypothetical protein